MYSELWTCRNFLWTTTALVLSGVATAQSSSSKKENSEEEVAQLKT